MNMALQPQYDKRRFAAIFLAAALLSLSSALMAELSDQLNEFVEEYIHAVPQETQQDYARGIEAVEDSGVMQSALQAGDMAPDFQLPNAVGEQVSLREQLEQGPVVLTWYRGGWCPYCNIQLQYLQQRLPDIKGAGGQLIAISPELPDKALSTREKHALQFEVLSDVGNVVASEYGITYEVPEFVLEHLEKSVSLAEYNGDNTNTLPLAATYIIDTDGTIVYAFLRADYRKRAEPDEIIGVLRGLSSE